MTGEKLVGCSTSCYYNETSSTSKRDYYTYYITLSTSDWDYAIFKSYSFESTTSNFANNLIELAVKIPKGVSPMEVAFVLNGNLYNSDWVISDSVFSFGEYSDTSDYYTAF